MATATKKSAQARNNEKIVRELERLGGQAMREESIERGGQMIRLPESMTLNQAWRFIRSIEQELEEDASFSRQYPYRPWDGAYAVWQVFRRVFGAVSHHGAMGFWGRSRPELIRVASGYNETTEVPWGELTIPALPEVTFILGSHHDGERGELFQLYASGPRKHKAAIYGVFELVEEELRERSLYRGKAFDGAEHPNFIDLSAVDPSKVVFSTTSYEAMKANIWTPIRHADRLNALGTPRKRAVLLHGEWGTGKTLTAYLTAQIAVRHGWTFLRARPGVDDLHVVMQTAKLYAPAVVFFEDIDVISDPSSLEADEASRLLDSFDGIAAKGQDVLAVMTTNHIERIHKGMVRPGRLDAVIELGALDSPNTIELLLATIPVELSDDDDINQNADAVAAAHEGYTPAFVVEAAGRAIRHAVGRSTNGDTPRINAADLINAAESLRNQLELMQGARDEGRAETIDNRLQARVKETVEATVPPLVRDAVNDYYNS